MSKCKLREIRDNNEAIHKMFESDPDLLDSGATTMNNVKREAVERAVKRLVSLSFAAGESAKLSRMKKDNWYERGELPPVGARVDVVGDVQYGAGETNCEVIAHVENCAVIRMSYGLGCFESRVLRPIQSERDRVIEAAHDVFRVDGGDVEDGMQRLYDAGMLKLPEGER